MSQVTERDGTHERTSDIVHDLGAARGLIGALRLAGVQGEGRAQVCGGGGLAVRMGRVLKASVLTRTGE